LLSVPWVASRSVLSCAQRWTDAVVAARAYANTAPAGIATIAYEQLLRDPDAQVQYVCEFLDLPFEPTMLDEFGKQAARNISRSETWKRDVARGVLVDRSGVWRERMSPGQAWLVAQATRRLRAEYGYRGQPRATLPSIIRAAIEEARIRFDEARPSTGVVGAARHAGTVLKMAVSA
jgi:hypothetical protein